MFMLLTLTRAASTDIGTHVDQLPCVVGIEPNKRTGSATDERTFSIQPNAIGEHMQILFMKATIEALLAGQSTFTQDRKQILLLLIQHTILHTNIVPVRV